MKTFFATLALAAVTGCMICTANPAMAAPKAACERPQRLRFSFVPQGRDIDQQSAFGPLVEELRERLKMPVDVIVPTSYGGVIEGLIAGAIDVARLGPASYVTARKGDPQITPFASMEQVEPNFAAQGGVSSVYYALLITRQQGPYDSVASLKGRVLALADPDSTSGALIPRHLFARQYKLQFDQYFSRIGYSGNHEKSVMAVLNHNADAAFVASTNLSRMISDGQLKKSDVRVLWRSGAIPFDPFVYRGQLCTDIRNKIREVFLDKNALRVKLSLDNLRATHFVPVRDADYQIIRALP
ncbi:phosphate/phosphite/phosphonate ABC transporter substrate-binding protein [Herbaspirillum sp. RU 5E]|uniref:Phosphonate ABC transporter substrate-binding protein n=1 Tax=Herbaspirillum aquaticum TaxID=568783 RepID=A0A225SSJ9_9BURK|nr:MULTISPECIES: phosphate/phosphite/phosphonate ABC transporter substrate-binding protein [Herbaspirillum]MBW9334130.1 phosphate/phosphite/phosphonate ABC transporter substrate-binding protein [Herbaspirillum sp. RU 5E]MRT28105.1 phosphate/phosphite/phosphonate ABC transporter substrate-binding protein [Herbaspirillum sp. CAH-3]OWY34082.1 phosphonate ABC transporter substrate-binding protein [Herbaspirillum aquaticum]